MLKARIKMVKSKGLFVAEIHQTKAKLKNETRKKKKKMKTKTAAIQTIADDFLNSHQ